MKHISLKKIGSFYIGGRQVRLKGMAKRTVKRSPEVSFEVDENGTYHIEQAYVQYFIPDPTQEKLPIIFVHGGGHTGSIWETTPDERDGWFQYFLELNHPIYIVDNVERGRAGWCSIPGFWQEKPETRSAERAWKAFRFGSKDNFYQKLSYENQQFPIQNFDQFIQHNVPRWNCNLEASTYALKGLINKIGDCIIVSHSQGCQFAIESTLSSQYVKATVLIEPPTIPQIQVTSGVAQNKNFLFVFGDFIEKSKFWTLSKNTCISLTEKLKAANAHVNWLDLPEEKIFGNSHMLIMDKNNIIIADKIRVWLESLKINVKI